MLGAASFEAMRAYEKHEEQNGKPESHEMAKELLAGRLYIIKEKTSNNRTGFAGAESDKLMETKGLDWLSGEENRGQVRQQAINSAQQGYDYRVQGQGY